MLHMIEGLAEDWRQMDERIESSQPRSKCSPMETLAPDD
jgi:hypothetical protein